MMSLMSIKSTYIKLFILFVVIGLLDGCRKRVEVTDFTNDGYCNGDICPRNDE